MIVLKAKAESSSASPINLSTPDEKSHSKSSLSFGQLLRGVKKEMPDEVKVAQKGTVVLAIDDKEVVLPIASTKISDLLTPQDSQENVDQKTSGLLSLLKGDAAILGEEIETLELSPKVTENLSISELKTLINDAKVYLKDQILKSDGYKKSQIKNLPQTLKGLAQLAKKFDIDISKITLEQVRPKALKVDVKSEEKEQVKVQTKQTNKSSEVDDAPETPLDLKVDKKTSKLAKSTTVLNDSKNINDEVQKEVKQDNRQNIKSDAKNTEKISVAQTPIFKAQSSTAPATTEQVVQAKQFVALPTKTPKDRADETLKLLLRGEKPSHSLANTTADFSVATAKVIAPSATPNASVSLETLLRGDSNGQHAEVKTEQIATPKVDTFEVKLNEAKQMVKYISTDVKQAIEDYKSPFTRIKVQLNPQQLGSVELTVVQRGKNLHVNISSNNVAVNALAMNLSELKTQLSNTGINNATFNFNSGSENGSSSNEQQRNRQQEQQDASEEYNYFDLEGQNEEILSSLEIVVPSYA